MCLYCCAVSVLIAFYSAAAAAVDVGEKEKGRVMEDWWWRRSRRRRRSIPNRIQIAAQRLVRARRYKMRAAVKRKAEQSKAQRRGRSYKTVGSIQRDLIMHVLVRV